MAVTLHTGTVGDAMTPGILTCLPETSPASVARMMAAHRVHAIVVFDNDDDLRPWGVVSDLDLIGALETGACAGAVAASPAVTVRFDEPLSRAAQLMREHAAAHLIVVTDGRTPLPIGIISTLDVARAVGEDEPPVRSTSGNGVSAWRRPSRRKCSTVKTPEEGVI